MWTNEDLAMLSHRAVELFLMDDSVYCEHCDIVPVVKGEKYCIGCVSDMLEDMAKEHKEQVAMEGGLY